MRKILFTLNQPDKDGNTSEIIWGEEEGSCLFRLAHSPFHALGISKNDLVIVKEMDEDTYAFEGIIERSGHSTFHLMVNQDTVTEDQLKPYKKEFELLRCTFEKENFSSMIHALDVPKGTELKPVLEILKRGQQENIWMFIEANMRHPQD